jgi:DNA-directed RNA polymerase subunit RPC12/RpoP
MTTDTQKPAAKPAKPKTSGFSCMECGRKFKTLAGAEKAQSQGCPKCGGCDVDLTPAKGEVAK